MIITVASLALRFYKADGWSEEKIRELLVNSKDEITLTDSRFLEGNWNYYAIYKNSGQKIFKKSETDKHTFDDAQNFGGIDWYVDEDK